MSVCQERLLPLQLQELQLIVEAVIILAKHVENKNVVIVETAIGDLK